jgi:hypothetical protein
VHARCRTHLSKTFVRPTITTHTSAAVQTEGAAASATTMVIASNTVTKTTVAGQVTITQQDIDFTDPAAMNLILNDLAGEYMIKTDDIAADALVAGKTASGSTWTVTAADPTTLINSLYDAAREITEDSNYFPTHLAVSFTRRMGKVGQPVRRKQATSTWVTPQTVLLVKTRLVELAAWATTTWT